MIPNEEQEQTLVLEWAAWMAALHPELKLLYHIPNGGKRSKSEAARLKAAGVKRGVPDLCLPVANRGFHGLYIEMKVQGGRAIKDQLEWIDSLRKQGYKAEICYGASDAISVIEEYIKTKKEG